MTLGAVILCGGKSRRMGQDKFLLTVNGTSFLNQILSQLKGFNEILLSVGKDRAADFCSCYPTVIDWYDGCGPMGGLHAALQLCRSDALLVVSCDLPCFSSQLTDLLCSELTPDIDAVIPVSPDGRIHPLCAVYRKNTWPVFESFLQRGDYKLRSALAQLRTRYVPVPDALTRCLTNVNTPAEYRVLLERT